MNLNIPELQHGGFMVKLSQSGNLLGQARSYGYMGNVRVLCFHTYPGTHHFHVRSWSREECPLVRKPFRIIFHQLNRCHHQSSSIIQNILDMRVSGRASLAFFYCDFREGQKKDVRGLLSSLLVQLCGQSDAYISKTRPHLKALDILLKGFK